MGCVNSVKLKKLLEENEESDISNMYDPFNVLYHIPEIDEVSEIDAIKIFIDDIKHSQLISHRYSTSISIADINKAFDQINSFPTSISVIDIEEYSTDAKEEELENHKKFLDTNMKLNGIRFPSPKTHSTCSQSNRSSVQTISTAPVITDNLQTQKMCVKKYLKSDHWNEIRFRREAKILSTIKHNHAIQYITSYMDNDSYYLLTQYCTGGTLLSFLTHLKIYSESTVANVIYTVMDVVQYCHSLNIVHRNLCLENLFLSKPNGRIIVGGWEDSEFIQQHRMYNDMVGQLYYLSPECLRHRHGWELKKVDLWAVGVMTYILTFGRVPFPGSDNASVCRNIMRNKYMWPDMVSNEKYSAKISDICKTFIRFLLEKQTYSRKGAKQIICHSFLNGKASGIHMRNGILFKLHSYQCSMKIHKLVIQRDCQKWTKFEQNEFFQVLENILGLETGNIKLEDIYNLLIKMGLKSEECKEKSVELFAMLDPNGNVEINLESSEIETCNIELGKKNNGGYFRVNNVTNAGDLVDGMHDMELFDDEEDSVLELGYTQTVDE